MLCEYLCVINILLESKIPKTTEHIALDSLNRNRIWYLNTLSTTDIHHDEGIHQREGERGSDTVAAGELKSHTFGNLRHTIHPSLRPSVLGIPVCLWRGLLWYRNPSNPLFKYNLQHLCQTSYWIDVLATCTASTLPF